MPRVPEGPQWSYEFKLDGYRLEAVKSAGKITLYSRRQNVLNTKFPYIAVALKGLPDETVIDGELVALASDGRPKFQFAAKLPFRRVAHHLLRLRCDDAQRPRPYAATALGEKGSAALDSADQ